MRLSVVLSLLFYVVPLTADSHAATIPCGERGDIIRMLAKKYREEPRAMGIDANSTLIEIFASPAGTWTILVTRPNGSSCVVGAGDSWEEMPPVTLSQQTRT